MAYSGGSAPPKIHDSFSLDVQHVLVGKLIIPQQKRVISHIPFRCVIIKLPTDSLVANLAESCDVTPIKKSGRVIQNKIYMCCNWGG